jgi:hypothetical protein
MVDRVPLRDMARSVPAHGRGDPVHQLEEAIRVRAWIVTARGADVELDAEATAWTPRAVHVHYFDADGREGFTWVWASAVTRV